VAGEEVKKAEKEPEEKKRFPPHKTKDGVDAKLAKALKRLTNRRHHGNY